MDLQRILSDFDPTIVNRGRRYFEEGRVVELEETAPGEYEAVVEGSERYHVSVSLDENGDADYDCDCPYWDAPRCKHVAAVLMAIEKRPNGEVGARPKQRRTPELPDALSEEALVALPAQRLAALLRGLIERYPESGEWLRMQLRPAEDALQSYRRWIRASIEEQVNRGYVPYRAMYRAMAGARDALEHLEGMAETAAVDQVIDFTLMLMKEMVRLMDMGDDSDGDAGGIVDCALRALDGMLEKRVLCADEPVRRDCFNRLYAAMRDRGLSAENMWGEELMERCVRIADGMPELRPPLLELQRQAMDNAEGYSQQYKQHKYFTLLERWEGAERAWAFAEQHMDNDRFCVMRYEALCEQRQYEQAVAFCEERIRREPDWRWKERLYEAYEQMGDRNAQRQLGEQMLLEGNRAYYDKLKALYSPEAWKPRREALLDALMAREPSWLGSAYAQIIIAERDAPRMMALVERNPDAVVALHEHLIDRYPEQVREKFQQALRQRAERASDRNMYRQVCADIELFARACGAETAREIVGEFQNQYKRRRAFQEELRQTLNSRSLRG